MRFGHFWHYYALLKPILIILFIYLAIQHGIKWILTVPESIYEAQVLLFSFFHYRFQDTLWLVLVSACLLLAVLLYYRWPFFKNYLQSLLSPWQEFEAPRFLRYFLCLVVFLLTWLGTSYEFNFYFNQSHVTDRVLLLILAGMVLWRPIFLIGFVFQFSLIWNQFLFPFGYNPSLHEINLLTAILHLLLASFLYSAWHRKFDFRAFWILLICLIASMYWVSGLGKFRLNWLGHPFMHYLLLGAYSGGWLAFLDADTMVKLCQFMSWFTIPLMLFTLFVEWAVLFILWRPKWLKIFLISFILFHLGIFATSGMFFWKWILVELALLIWFNRKGRHWLPDLFQKPLLWLSVGIITFSSFLFPARNLSWYDTPLAYTYHIEGIAENGLVYQLPAYAFRPYSDLFTLGAFDYLNPHPQLTGLWDISSTHAIADTLVQIQDKEQVFELEKQMAKVRYDETQASHFNVFMHRFQEYQNQHPPKDLWISHLQPPAHLWNYPRSTAWNNIDRLSQIHVYQKTRFFDGQDHRTIRTRWLFSTNP